jgi:hypothetical protein
VKIAGIYRRSKGICIERINRWNGIVTEQYVMCRSASNCSMTVVLEPSQYVEDVVLSYCDRHGGTARLEIELVQNFGFDGDPEKIVDVPWK